jgi:hypothetical protein
MLDLLGPGKSAGLFGALRPNLEEKTEKFVLTPSARVYGPARVTRHLS